MAQVRQQARLKKASQGGGGPCGSMRMSGDMSVVSWGVEGTVCCLDTIGTIVVDDDDGGRHKDGIVDNLAMPLSLSLALVVPSREPNNSNE